MTSFGLIGMGMKHRAFRNAMMVVLMTLASGTLTLTVAVNTRIAALVAGDRDYLVVVASEEDADLPYSHLVKLRQLPKANVLAWINLIPVSDGANYRYGLVMASSGYPDHVQPSWFSVPSDVAKRWREQRDGVIVGFQTLEKMNWKVGSPITLKTPLGDIGAQVSGVATGYSPGNVLIHYEYVEALARRNGQELGLGSIWVDAPVASDPGQLAGDIDQLFKSTPEPTITVPFRELMSSQIGKAATVPRLLANLGIVVVIVTTMIILSTLIVSLRERRTELATLRVLGFNRMNVVRLVVLESVALCATGGMLGSFGLLILYHRDGIAMGPGPLREVTIGVSACLIGVAVSVLVGAAVGFYPALLASRQNVAAVLAEGR